MWVPIVCSAGILAFSVSLLRVSGVWSEIFAPLKLRPKETFDPLVASPSGRIENHAFWDNHPEESDDHAIDSIDFWETDSKRFAS